MVVSVSFRLKSKGKGDKKAGKISDLVCDVVSCNTEWDMP